MSIPQPNYPISTSALVEHIGGYADARGRLESIDIYGHSIAGAGGTFLHQGYAQRLARMLGAQRIQDRAIGGAVASRYTTNGTGDGGFPLVLQDGGKAGYSAYTQWTPITPAAIIDYGLNDLAATGSNKLLPYTTAMRTILSRVCAAVVWEDTDAGWTRSGTWGQIGITSGNSGTSVYGSSTLNNYAEFTLPADYPGGLPVALGMFIRFDSGFNVEISVDGAPRASQTIDGPAMCDTSGSGYHNNHTIRVGTGASGDAVLSAGAHTIRITHKGNAAVGTDRSLYLDYIQVEANPLDGPLIIAPQQFKPQTYSLWESPTWARGYNAGTNPMNDAAVDELKVAQAAVLSEFDMSRVVSTDRDLVAERNSTFFSADGAHPNARGHAIFAQQIYEDILASGKLTPRRVARPTQPNLDRWWTVGSGYNSVATYNGTNWAAYGSASFFNLMYRRDPNGLVHIRGATHNNSGGALSQTIFTLPGGFRPLLRRDFPVVVYDSTNGYRTAVARVNETGTVFLMSTLPVSTAASYVYFDYQFEADQ